ncbi:putative RNA polymerase ECF-subfamily sigma factor [Streptomyces formicae]|uniref:Putative RNA polymerase ECF-subfamily sigma factor n=1 Tax=Streptomyces formicae TaxID=1616117 RepID=A0A291Q0D6_9ACTN|nr:putative RNA polymerase ECF-subfamily sigma factor [Streptomyces formicae]
MAAVCAGAGAVPRSRWRWLLARLSQGRNRSDARDRPSGTASEEVDRLYRHRRLDLVRLAVLLVDDVPTAEDVVQEAFAALYRRHGASLDGIADPEAYIRRSVVNTSRDVLRRRRAVRAYIPPAHPPRTTTGRRDPPQGRAPGSAAGTETAHRAPAGGPRPQVLVEHVRSGHRVDLGPVSGSSEVHSEPGTDGTGQKTEGDAMTAVEDRLRATLQARAEQVTALRPASPPSARARTDIHPRLRKVAVVLVAAAVTAILLMLPRLLSHDAPPAPADTLPPTSPNRSTSPSPTLSPRDETPGPVTPSNAQTAAAPGPHRLLPSVTSKGSHPRAIRRSRVGRRTRRPPC